MYCVACITHWTTDGGHTETHTHTHTHTQKHTHTHRHTDTQTDRQTNGIQKPCFARLMNTKRMHYMRNTNKVKNGTPFFRHDISQMCRRNFTKLAP